MYTGNMRMELFIIFLKDFVLYNGRKLGKMEYTGQENVINKKQASK